MGETERSLGSLEVAVFDRQESSWEKIKDVVGGWNKEEFGMNPEEPLLGETDDIVAYGSLRGAFLAPETSALLLRNGANLVGYALAMPIDKMDPSRSDEASSTAYFYLAVLDKTVRGRGLIGTLSSSLFSELYRNGYRFVEKDYVRKDGKADSAQRHFENFPGSIDRDPYDHEKFPEFGPQRHFRINLKAYLTQRGLVRSNEGTSQT